MLLSLTLCGNPPGCIQESGGVQTQAHGERTGHGVSLRVRKECVTDARMLVMARNTFKLKEKRGVGAGDLTRAAIVHNNNSPCREGLATQTAK